MNVEKKSSFSTKYVDCLFFLKNLKDFWTSNVIFLFVTVSWWLNHEMPHNWTSTVLFLSTQFTYYWIIDLKLLIQLFVSCVKKRDDDNNKYFKIKIRVSLKKISQLGLSYCCLLHLIVLQTCIRVRNALNEQIVWNV